MARLKKRSFPYEVFPKFPYVVINLTTKGSLKFIDAEKSLMEARRIGYSVYQREPPDGNLLIFKYMEG